MSMPKVLFAAIFGVCVLMFFQNCQKAKMATTGTDESSLARVNEADLELPPGPGPNPNPNPNPGPTPNPCPDDNGDHDSHSRSDDDSHDHSKHGHHKGRYGHDMCDDESSDDHSADDCKDPRDGRDREYICDIRKPGNDHAIGITEQEQLIVKHQGVKLVCMSKQACEVIAAAAFPGARAEPRGFCKAGNNPNVKHVSDERMKQLVDKFIQQHGVDGQ